MALASIFGFGNESQAQHSSSKKKQKIKPVQLLVIQSDGFNWYKLFEGLTLNNGRPIKVVQRGWREIVVSSDNFTKNKCVVHCNRSVNKFWKDRSKEPNSGPCTVIPDFILCRNEVRVVDGDHRNKLIGLMFCNIPAINTLKSIYMFCDRPVIMAELNALNQIHGDNFPVIQQEYYCSHRSMMYSNKFPCVVKVGYAHAGMGKMRINHHHDFEDFRTVVAMGPDYCTAEPFLKGAFDLRIQKCGEEIKAFKRISLSGTWKTNTGSAHLEEIEVTDEYRRWAELAGTIFGGLDICTVDAIHNEDDDKEYILEVNGGSSGWSPDTAEDDNLNLRDMVLSRLNGLYGNSEETEEN